MIVHYLDAGAIGGIETHVETVVRALNADGWPASVLLHRDHAGSPVRARYAAAGLTVHVADECGGVAAALKRLSPALLHTHGYKAGLIGRPLARLHAIPVISTWHAGERAKGRVRIYQLADEWTGFLGARLAVSRPIAAKLPFGATVMRNFVSVPPRMRAQPDEDCFVFAGRLSHEKGPDLFCALAQRFAGHGQFELHGDGPMRGELEPEFGHVAAFRGFTPAIAPVLARTSALVMTSRREGLPMIALEAMAAGVPVIAPATGALPDLIADGRNGILYETADGEALAAALDRFMKLDRQARHALGEAARRTIIEAYSPQAVLPDLLAAYTAAGWAPALSTSTNVQSSAG